MCKRLIKGWARMKKILFSPFDLNKWFMIGFTAFLAGLAILGVTAEDVDAAYREGVTKSLTFWGQDIPGAIKTLTNTEISDYVNTLTDITTLTQAEALTSIIEEQYLDTFLRAVEGWTHVRRTKVPDIGAAPGSTITTMLKRFNYPTA